MKDRLSIFFLLIFLVGVIVGCSGPKTMLAERKSECGCGQALTTQEDMDKMVIEDILTRIANE
jgi:hypothetical protein